MGYVEFMLEQQTIDAKTFEEPKIIYIEPESLGKAPSHSLWVMGLGNETWEIHAITTLFNIRCTIHRIGIQSHS